MAKAASSQANTQFDRIAAACAALVIVGLVVFLLIRNEEIADARLFFALRLVLSFGAAVLGATIPGFLSVGWSGGGLTVRAGGALALFVLTYIYSTRQTLRRNRVTVGRSRSVLRTGWPLARSRTAPLLSTRSRPLRRL
jgi:hypothetical protein